MITEEYDNIHPSSINHSYEKQKETTPAGFEPARANTMP
jgi:hypothetical protein